MDSAGVSQIMQPWLVTCPVVTLDTRLYTQSPKSAAYCGLAQWSTVPETEEWGSRLPAMNDIALLHVLHHRHVLTQRHQPRLVELGLLNTQEGLIKIDIVHCQP